MQHVKTIQAHRKAVYCVAPDRSGRFVLTGADDGTVNIWDLGNGLLKASCRGHLGEITDLKINSNATLFASCSTDWTSRVWSLEEETLGRHVQTMHGHRLEVTFVSFSLISPHALLSVSLDGTCRLWHALSGIEVLRLKPLGTAGHFYNDCAFEKPLEQAIGRQIEVQFASDEEEATSSNGLTCCAFSPNGRYFAVSSQSGQCFIWHWNIDKNAEWNGARTWPDVTSCAELSGHEEPVFLLQFNLQGTALCTASTDGHVKIWSPLNGENARNASPDESLWSVRWSFMLPDSLPCLAYNNRRCETVPECNQIAWSCDNQFIMAAYSCSVIMVWNATNGKEETILCGGHTASPVHVLAAHPTDPKLCFSAGYDGMLILWDVVAGRKITVMSSQGMHSERWHQADRIQFIDGCFQQDGMGIVVSDAAGRVHLYSLDIVNHNMQTTSCDQFCLHDYDKAMIDVKEEQVDIGNGAPEDIQGARFSSVVNTEVPHESSVGEHPQRRTGFPKLLWPSDPPRTITEALWRADEIGLRQMATHIATAQQSQIALRQEQGGEEETARPVLTSQVDDLSEMEADGDLDGKECTLDEVEPPNILFATRQSERVQLRINDCSPRPRGHVCARQQSEVPQEVHEISHEAVRDHLDGEVDEEEIQLLRTADVVAGQSGDNDGHEDNVAPEWQRLQPWLREQPCSVPRARRRQRRRRGYRLPHSRCPEMRSLRIKRMYRAGRYENEDMELTADLPQHLRTQSSARSRRAARRAAVVEAAEVGDTSLVQYAGRHLRAYQWLSERRRPVGYYVPQKGDSTVYFSRLHGRFCERNPQLTTQLNNVFVDGIRYAEPCEVLEVIYEIFRDDKLSPTVARVKLRLTDERRYGPSATFQLYIPPPYFGHEEFLISLAVFHDTMSCNFNVGEEVDVFYFGEDKAWWSGIIVDDQRPHSYCERVWECEDQYRRYIVELLETSEPQSEYLSPWEMVALPWQISESQSAPEQRLDAHTRNAMLGILAEAISRPDAEHFRETPEPDCAFIIPGRFRREDRKLYYNQAVPLPISLQLIAGRVKGNYYASVEAFKADVHLIVENAHLFTEPTSDVSKQSDSLERFILRSLALGLGSLASPS